MDPPPQWIYTAKPHNLQEWGGKKFGNVAVFIDYHQV